MFAKWTKILPVFLVEWMALRYCEKIPMSLGAETKTAVNPYSRFIIFTKGEAK